MTLRRRSLLIASGLTPLAACRPEPSTPAWQGGWVGADAARGHRVRDTKSGSIPPPAVRRRAGVIVVGAGIAGLSAARALRRAGIDDVQVFDLEAEAGGNSRGHSIAGIGCPLGAHYLPLPGEEAVEVIELLEELGIRRTEYGRPVYDERNLCHSPQERLFIDGQWHEGLLPPVEALPAAERAVTLAAYRRFAAAVARVSGGSDEGGNLGSETGSRGHHKRDESGERNSDGDSVAAADSVGKSSGKIGRVTSRGRAFAMPTARADWSPALQALDAVTFAHWLDAEGLTAPALRWYLDYCCRDDYGAGAAQVSAWAGLHYFASRHGFHAPAEGGDGAGGRSGAEPSDGLLTWPEGNAWLSRRLAAPLGARLHPSMVALKVTEGRHEVEVDLWNVTAQRVERWTSPQVVLAVPLFVAARLLQSPPPALLEAAAAMRYAPWLVANLHIGRALDDRPGAAPAWDNVRYGSRTLGYVDAAHQSLLPYADATVLTAYWALGGADDAEAATQRHRLLDQPWSVWANAVVDDLQVAHPDLRDKLRQVDLMRYGHAMSIPHPGLRSSTALRALGAPQPRVQFAHADLSGYSVFEEALYRGHQAARAVARRLEIRAFA